MRKAILSILGGAIFLLPLMFASCGNIDNPLEILDTSGSGGGGGGAEETTTNTYKVWNGTEFVDTKIPTDAIDIETLTSGDLAAGTYIVKGSNVIIDFALILKGDVSLILSDGAKLTVNNGIATYFDGETPVGTLSIYAQSNGESMGQLVVKNNTPTANLEYPELTEATAILAKQIIIHGGKVAATKGTTPATFGAGLETVSGDMVIYGGEITAEAPGSGIMVNEGNLTILAGIITITSTINSAIQVSCFETGGNMEIDGGTITANGGDCMEGILVQGTVTIKGGTVNANGGDGNAAALGQPAGGDGIQASAVDVQGGSLTAIGGNGDDVADDNGGDGGHGIEGNVSVSGTGSVTATGGNGGAGGDTHDGGAGGHGIFGTVVTGTPAATGGTGGAAGEGGNAGADGLNIADPNL